jgi:chromate transporter
MTAALAPPINGRTAPPSFAVAVRFWLKLGCISFGGPAGQIGIMQTELVDRRGWVDQRSFLTGLNFCTLLPGPEAIQLATYIGWRLHGLRGGLAAGGLFLLPGALIMLALSWLAALHRDTPLVAAVFAGLKPVVVAIVLAAVWRIGRRALRGGPAVALAAAAFVAIYGLGIDFPWIVLAAGLTGWLAARAGLSSFAAPAHGDVAAVGHGSPARVGGRGWRRIGILVAVFATLWAVPVAGVIAVFGTTPFVDVAALFTTAAFVTFGGAYAVLPYVADAAVDHYGWLSAGEMLNGLALAETTPGPLILVLQYVGFFAGWNAAAGTGAQGLAAAVAAGLTTYVTFLPSFLFIFAGAPYVEAVHRVPALGSALGAITAAVVGVVLNLAVFFATAVFLPPNGVDWPAVGLAAAALAVLLRFAIGLHWMVAAGAVAGLVRYWL